MDMGVFLRLFGEQKEELGLVVIWVEGLINLLFNLVHVSRRLG